MRLVLATFCLAFVLLGCSKPEDIVFGPEPLKQFAEQGDQFKKMPEEDRMLLVGYLGAVQISKSFGGNDIKSPTGRTVGEVLVDARAWREKIKVAETEAAKRAAEAAALKAKVLAERKEIADRIAASVVVAVLGSTVKPEDYRAGRYSATLGLSYAVENKAAKGIKQLKGIVTFKDATGDTIGWLPVEFDEPIAAGKTLKTNTGYVWKINQFKNGDIEKIAAREFSSMSTSFAAESVAFSDGEILKAPARTE